MSNGDDAREPRAQSDLSKAAAGQFGGGYSGRVFTCGGCDRVRRRLKGGGMCEECREGVKAFDAAMASFRFPRHGEDSNEFWLTYYELRHAAGLPLFADLDRLEKALSVMRGGPREQPNTFRAGYRPGSWNSVGRGEYSRRRQGEGQSGGE